MFTFAGISFIYNPMKMGMVGLYQPKFDAGEWLRIVERERPTMAFLVPAMAELLVAHPDFATADLTSLQAVSIGSAPLAPNTLLTLVERLPHASVANSYGMTEAGPAFIVMPQEEVTKRIGSVGKPLPPMEIKIVDDEDNERAGPRGGRAAHAPAWATAGVLQGRRRHREHMDARRLAAQRRPRLPRRRRVPVPRRAQEGSHRPGRPQRLPDRHRERDPRAPRRCAKPAVVGIPHDVLGEDIAAFVVRKPDAAVGGDELQAFCADHLADYKRPRQVTFVDELPRNATGKVMKHLLGGNAVGTTGGPNSS